MNLLAEMRTKIHAVLQPLVDPLADYSVRQIKDSTFSSTQDLDELLERFRDLMPGAYLSVPGLQYNTAPSSLRACDVTMNYGFLIGMEDRRSQEIKQAFAEELQDKQLQHLLLQRVTKQGIPCTSIDFIRPKTWDFEIIPDTSLAAIYLTFSIDIRNWMINTPA
jgi:hypothetical protein